MGLYSLANLIGRNSGFFAGVVGVLATLFCPASASAGLLDFLFQERASELNSRHVFEDSNLQSVLSPYLSPTDQLALSSTSKTVAEKMQRGRVFDTLVLGQPGKRDIPEAVFRSLFSETGRYRSVRVLDLRGIDFQPKWLEALPLSVEELALWPESRSFYYSSQEDSAKALLPLIQKGNLRWLHFGGLSFPPYDQTHWRRIFNILVTENSGCASFSAGGPTLEEMDPSFLGRMDSWETAEFYECYCNVQNAVMTHRNAEFFSFDHVNTIQRLTSLEIKGTQSGEIPAEFYQMESLPQLASLSLTLTPNLPRPELVTLLPNLENLNLELPSERDGGELVERFRPLFSWNRKLKSLKLEFYSDHLYPLPFESISPSLKTLEIAPRGQWDFLETLLDGVGKSGAKLERLVLAQPGNRLGVRELEKLAGEGRHVLPSLTHLELETSFWVSDPKLYYRRLFAHFPHLREIQLTQPGATLAAHFWKLFGTVETVNLDWAKREQHTLRLEPVAAEDRASSYLEQDPASVLPVWWE